MSMKAIKLYLILNVSAPATLENSFDISCKNMAQIMNPPSLIYSKYFTQQLWFQSVTVIQLNCFLHVFFSKLNVNELKNLNCIYHDLFHQGHGSLVPFIIFLC